MTICSLIDPTFQTCLSTQSQHFLCVSGDSGGPLLIPDKPNGNVSAGLPQLDLIVGVASFGSEACDTAVPGLYTKISYAWEWISEIIGGLNSTNAEASLPEITDVMDPDRDSVRTEERSEFKEAYGSDFEDLSNKKQLEVN